MSTLTNIAQNNPNSPIWIACDFNLPDINWEDGSITGHNYPHNFAELLLDFINTFGFTQTVDSPTRRNNTLDLFLTNRPSLVTSCKVIPGFSNHEIVHVSTYVIAPSNFSARSVPLWHKADFDLIRETILNFSDYFLNEHTTDTPVNILWEEYKSLCESCLTLVPHTQTSDKHRSPWITKQIKRLSRQKQRRYNKARSTNLSNDWENYYSIKKELQRVCRNSHNNYLSSLLSSESKPTKRFWAFIKNKRKDQVSINTLCSNGHTYTDSRAKADVLNNYFSTVFTNEDLTSLPTIDSDPIPDISPLNIDLVGVQKLLEDLDAHKALGPDNIPPRLLKDTADLMAPLLTLIFPASLNQGLVLDDWKKANVVPCHKKGPRNSPGNYHPISLTCICCKTLEHVIFSHLNRHNVLCDNQRGFRSKRLCETQLLGVVFNSGEQIDALFLDFLKAFDKVSS